MAALKTDASNLLALAPRDLTQAFEILCEEFEKQVARRSARHSREVQILKIIFLGLSARSRQVIDPVGRYLGLDIRVIVSCEDLADAAEYWVQFTLVPWCPVLDLNIGNTYPAPFTEIASNERSGVSAAGQPSREIDRLNI